MAVRAANDSALLAAGVAESTARAAADTAETDARVSADTTEIGIRTSNISSVLSAMAAEATLRQTTDTALSNAAAANKVITSFRASYRSSSWSYVFNTAAITAVPLTTQALVWNPTAVPVDSIYPAGGYTTVYNAYPVGTNVPSLYCAVRDVGGHPGRDKGQVRISCVCVFLRAYVCVCVCVCV